MQLTKAQFIIFVVGLVIIFSFCVPWQSDVNNGINVDLGFHSLVWQTDLDYDQNHDLRPSIDVGLFALVCILWCIVFYLFIITNWNEK